MQLRGLTHSSLSRVALAVIALAVAPLSGGQQIGGGAGAVTVADYQRAEKFLPYSTRPLVFHDVRATWLPGDRFWYRDTSPNGIEFVMYDAARGTRQPHSITRSWPRGCLRRRGKATTRPTCPL
jgi:hypothetical protein